MVPKLELASPAGDALILLSVLPGEPFFEADGYVAERSADALTHYTVRTGDAVHVIRTEQAIKAGAWFYPGDPRHFGRLSERPLFRIVEVTRG